MRESYVEGKTILTKMCLMEVERRMCFPVIENDITRNVISASTFPRHPQCNSIPSYQVSLLRDVRFRSSLHLLSIVAAWGNMRQRIMLYLVGVMIPYGKCQVNPDIYEYACSFLCKKPGHPQGECPYYIPPVVYSRGIPLAGALAHCSCSIILTGSLFSIPFS